MVYSSNVRYREQAMSNLQSSAVWPEDFCGRVKIFPLPNLVLFPNVVQPLHIFEPRYCEMLQDALTSDRLIAMAVLGQNWEPHYEQRPPIAPIVCVGKIISHTHCDEDRHNILLVGMKRARVVRELQSEKPYRVAQVEVLEDIYTADDTPLRPELIRRLQETFLSFVPEGLAAQESFRELMGKHLPLGALTDMITFAVNLPAPIKLQLLSEINVDIRCRILTRCLEQKMKSAESSQENSMCNENLPQNFPPRFSDN
jgi:uncharacterized protein